MKFAILDSFQDIDIEESMCHGHELIAYQARREDELPDEIDELDGCLVWHHIILSDKSFQRMKKCKVIVRIGVGYDTIDIRAAGNRGIIVCNVPDYGTNDVADHAMALLLSAVRSIPMYNNALHNDIQNNWVPSIGGKIHRITGSIIGIIGMGRIGHAVAVRAKAFGMKVCFYDPYISDGYDKSYLMTKVDSLEELFSVSDYISIHTPSTSETKGMIGWSLFEYCKKPVILINTARGNIVKLDDVYEGLKKRKLNFFAADVLETEPPVPENKLVKAFIEGEKDICARVILTPHAAFYAQESQIEMRRKATKILLDLAEDRSLRNCVNFQYLKTPRYELIDKSRFLFD